MNVRSISETVNTSDTVIINVGGQRHEILRSTLLSYPGTLFTKNHEFMLHYREEKDEYYFDRNPHLFVYILNYLRIGELHAPAEICGPMFRKELNFWGIDELELQDCCWNRYCSDIDTRALLKRFEDSEYVKEEDYVNASKWKKFCYLASEFFDNPHSSIFAKIQSLYETMLKQHINYSLNQQDKSPLQLMLPCQLMPISPAANGIPPNTSKIHACITVLIILISIVIFCLQTHTGVIGKMTKQHYADFYKVNVSQITDDGYYYVYVDVVVNNTKIITKIKKQLDVSLIPPHPTMQLLDTICTIYFTVEILLRFIFCLSKLKFFTKSLNICDLLAIAPYYLEKIVQLYMKSEIYRQTIVDVLFVLQIVRIFRIFRLIRHVKGIKVLMYTLAHSWRELLLLVLVLIIAMLLFGSLIFFAEHPNNNNIQNIPDGFWWAIVTMTTVGYGDMVPTTTWGYVVGSFCSISGVLLIAFSVPSLVNNFMMFYNFVHFDKEFKGKKKEHDKVNSVAFGKLFESTCTSKTKVSDIKY